MGVKTYLHKRNALMSPGLLQRHIQFRDTVDLKRQRHRIGPKAAGRRA